MSIPVLALIVASTLTAANVDTVLLGVPSGPQTAAADAQGNLVVAGNVQCSILVECQPISIVKVDPAGRVLFRRGIGEPTWRFNPTLAAVDREGNIVLAGSTGDPNLPIARATPSRFAGGTDVYVLQLSPDASRILFSAYVGGAGTDDPVAIDVDTTGAVVMNVRTTSADFPFTASEGPVPPANLTNVIRNAIVRLVPSTGRLAYAIGLPFSPQAFGGGLGLAPDGAVGVVLTLPVGTPAMARQTLVEIRPDGTRRVRPTNLPLEALPSRVAVAPDGGAWITGIGLSPFLPASPNAWQRASGFFTYQRAENQFVITPPGPIESQIVRFLAVDRADENIIYAVTARGLYRALDNGWTWELMNDEPFLRVTAGIAASRGRLWAHAGITTGVLVLAYSDDGGVSWSRVTVPGSVGGPLNLAAHPINPRVLYLTAGNTLYRTTDAGETWISRQFPVGAITGLAADEGHVAVSGFPQPPIGGAFRGAPLVFLSSNSGATFSDAAEIETGVLTTFRFDPNEPGSLYVMAGSRLVRTNPATFPRLEDVGAPAGPPLAQFGFQNGLPGVLVGYTADGTYFRSTDGGRTFRPAVSSSPGRFPSQLVMGAGGVAHVAFAALGEPFAAKLNAAGEVTYVTYLGMRRGGAVNSLYVTPQGRAVLTGQMEGFPEFPGDILRGTLPGLPPGVPSPPSTFIDIFAIGLEADGAPAFAAALAGVGVETLVWSGPGPDGSVLLYGVTSSPDFPGLAGPGPLTSSLFFSRLRP